MKTYRTFVYTYDQVICFTFGADGFKVCVNDIGGRK
jgi:hypothetical protein